MANSRSPAPYRAPRRNPLDLYEPRVLSVHSRWRFQRTRRALYLEQLAGRHPTPEEADIIAQLCRVGWDERVIRAEAEAATDQRVKAELRRQGAELGRQLILLRRDLDRAAPKPEPASAPQPTFDQVLAGIVARRSEPEDGDEEVACAWYLMRRPAAVGNGSARSSPAARSAACRPTSWSAPGRPATSRTANSLSAATRER